MENTKTFETDLLGEFVLFYDGRDHMWVKGKIVAILQEEQNLICYIKVFSDGSCVKKELTELKFPENQ